ncbi:MAG: hypothetical protein ABI665_04320 [Vicinamibacterales bacterium]
MKAGFGAVAVSLALTATGLAQSRTVAQAQAMAEFNQRVGAYMAQAKQLESSLPPLKKSDDAGEISAREVAFGFAIRTARSAARPGDIFTPGAAKVFRRIIKNDFHQRSAHRKKLVLDDIPHFRPKVNQTYPGEAPLATFPVTLLAALPVIPEGLEYRLLSDYLILRDVKANIIVDFVVDVF